LQPAFTSANLNADRLQIAVGVATFYDGTQGLNVVGTWRQPNGLSATGLSTPFITGPSGFVVPDSAQAGDDEGTNIISGSLQVLPGNSAKPTTLGTHNGVFSYGIQPDNSSTSGGLISGFNPIPFYADQDPNCTQSSPPGPCPVDEYIGGPPAFPNFQNGTYPSAFLGYSEGFTTFLTPPVAGSYSLQLTIQTSNAGTFHSPVVSSSLARTAGLPGWTGTASIVPAGANGAKISYTPPAGVTEVIVNVIDENTGGEFTAVDANASGSVTFPDNQGPGATATPTFNNGDPLYVQLLGVDYPAFEAAPPANSALQPTLLGAAGQADITLTFTGFTCCSVSDARVASKTFRPLAFHKRVR
jgi:hypothetical protein